jgi:sugar/nucleoside kinase (ribokinase family)
MLDVVAEPKEEEVADLDFAEASISFHAGGSGVNLALAATEAGFTTPSLVCSLGKDHFANSAIRAELDAAGVDLIANMVADQPTGVATIGYVSEVSRIMFAAPGANAAPLNQDTITDISRLRPDVVIVSGYMLSRPSTRDSVLEIMEKAARNGATVVLDLVPHSIHGKITSAQFIQLLAVVDFLAGDRNTFKAFGESADSLLQHVDGVFEYEVNGRYQAFNRAGQRVEGEFPRPERRAMLRGMTDRLLISLLRDIFLAAPS